MRRGLEQVVDLRVQFPRNSQGRRTAIRREQTLEQVVRQVDAVGALVDQDRDGA